MNRKFKILIIEDNLADFVLLEKALNLIEGVCIEIRYVQDGQEGINYVFKEGKYAGEATPDLIILDLNLPIKSGFEVLKKIKKDDIYKIIPIIIYSTSESSIDIISSYSLYANSYIAKTFDIKELFEKIKHFGNYWVKTVSLPVDECYCPVNEEK